MLHPNSLSQPSGRLLRNAALFSSSHSPSNRSVQEEDSDAKFESESFQKCMFKLSEEYELMMVDVLEATENTIQKNHERSLKKGLGT